MKLWAKQTKSCLTPSPRHTVSASQGGVQRDTYSYAYWNSSLLLHIQTLILFLGNFMVTAVPIMTSVYLEDGNVVRQAAEVLPRIDITLLFYTSQ